MSCADEPFDHFHVFIKAVRESGIDRPYEGNKFHPLVRTLALWGEINGFASAATWTKKILVGVLAPAPVVEFWASLGWDYDEGATLLSCFGDAFRGDQVGLVGRDIVEPCLHHQDSVVVAAALGVLESWLEDDEDGMWHQLLEEHSELEDDISDLEPGELEDEDVRQLELQGCGFGDVIEEIVPGLDEEIQEARELRRQELEPFFATSRGWPNSLRAVVQHSELPGFLERALELDPGITLGLLESRTVGTPCVRASNLQVHVERDEIVRAWNSELTVSLEPTATSGTWLVFAKWPSNK
jgi:hypothetical protein